MQRCSMSIQMTSDRPFSQAAAKNAAPILEILRHEFHSCAKVLEIGSGTGQHATHFAAALEHLDWQTSDLAHNHSGIKAWLAEANLTNVRSPIALDVTATKLETMYDAVYSANTAHIMSFDAVLEMIALVGNVLRPGGIFCLYGPFRRSGTFNTSSNARFDTSLRARDSAMGIRDLEDLDAAAAEAGMKRLSLYAVPSNNLVVLWQQPRRSQQ